MIKDEKNQRIEPNLILKIFLQLTHTPLKLVK